MGLSIWAAEIKSRSRLLVNRDSAFGPRSGLGWYTILGHPDTLSSQVNVNKGHAC